MVDPNLYYSRQMRLPEVGNEGQTRLQNAKCLVVGAGGLGAPALLYLAAAGIGTLGICDGDLLEESNLHRQPIYNAKDVGKSKADLATERVKNLNPLIHVVSYPYRLTAENALSLFLLYDIVLDCTDNFRTKFLINDSAYFAQKPVVRASIYQFEGQIQTYLPARKDACLRCLWEEVPQEGCVGTCQQVGVLGPVPGYFGILQAMEAIKFFLGLPTLQAHEILFTDLLYYSQRVISFERKPSCPLCGEAPSLQQPCEKESWELHASDLETSLFELIDIREVEETDSNPYLERPCLKMPMSSFDMSQLDPQIKYALFCRRGIRSAKLTLALKSKGLENIFSLIGGIEALQKNTL